MAPVFLTPAPQDNVIKKLHHREFTLSYLSGWGPGGFFMPQSFWSLEEQTFIYIQEEETSKEVVLTLY